MCSSKVFQITIHFIPSPLPKVLPLTCTPMKMNPKKQIKGLPPSHKKYYFGGVYQVLIFLGDGSMKITHCKKKKTKTWEAIH